MHDHPAEVRRPHVVDRQPVVVEHDVVRVEPGAVGRGDQDMMRHQIEDLAQLAFLLADLVLGLLPIVDVGPSGVPAYDPPSLVAHRVHTSEEPAVLTVPSPEARFALPRSARGKSALPRRRERIDVVRVCETLDHWPSDVFELQPVVVEHDLVAVDAGSVRCDDRDVMRN